MTNFWLHDEITLGDGTVVSIFDAYSGDLIPCANGVVYVPYTLMPGEWFKFSVTFTIPKDWTWCDDGEWMNNTFDGPGLLRWRLCPRRGLLEHTHH